MPELQNKLNQRISMTLKGYEKLWSLNVPYDSRGLYHYSFNCDSYEIGYQFFIQKIRESIGKKYLPIYRMADGEFLFSLKKYSLTKRIFSLLNNKNILFATCWGESYTKKEIDSIFPNYMLQLRKISECGFLALHFIESKENSYKTLMDSMMKWFDFNKIVINENNYTSFYYIYALFSGPHQNEFFDNKNILIVSHLTIEKEIAIRNNLRGAKNVNNVEFYKITHNKSFLEVIDLSKIKIKPDLILIAAGVGSINILEQFETLKTVCIDCGMVIDLIANNDLRFSRLFLNYNY